MGKAKKGGRRRIQETLYLGIRSVDMHISLFGVLIHSVQHMRETQQAFFYG